MKTLTLNNDPLSISEVVDYLNHSPPLHISSARLARVRQGQQHLNNLIAKDIPIYGVTTGFGDSVHRQVEAKQSQELQKNLISYLLCGSGASLPFLSSKATFLIRLYSLSRGHSGISSQLVQRMAYYLNQNWIPLIPREGSLGASGDLVPLAYLARALQGEGQIHGPKGTQPLSSVLKKQRYKPYTLKPKEGLALVNGTSAMAGLALHNLVRAHGLLNLSVLSSSWLVLALEGRPEAFGTLVNEFCSFHSGQAEIAKTIRELLLEENYQRTPLHQWTKRKSKTSKSVQTEVSVPLVQDRYSLRCTPQILGPVYETLQLAHRWIEEEINGASDNPLIADDGSLATGGNFYGGYLSHAMDYMKISLAQMADLTDRQLLFIIDEKSNRGLPPNLANWPDLPLAQRSLHHGLKGLHQSASALTSEIMALSIPNGIFSRSTESHNQDKVSLGMSAATQTHDLIGKLLTVQTLHLVALAQALDLKKVRLRSPWSLQIYSLIRKHLSFIEKDRQTDAALNSLKSDLDSLFWRNFSKDTNKTSDKNSKGLLYL